ncbi:RNA 2',3'-cyclic phosphodiesterase [Fuchsiella alkaliacetigena]|uniref:RNA 2',3'-cyclic phosphodiesterase n=1 Tax=Fuchsiella alkaliacetigena TaxID=957042 RepID=UPI00200A57CA|nr:RNA 2',3'-cyclic phosphodiesterase [Fuchsiella alkaliacetigena]MCK8825676.1 RNA 2',3'-cyclic phosphodiesterase [Fuchsiella alkaliacetigena]
MRTFVAIDLEDQQIKRRLIEVQQQLKTLEAGKIKLVDPEQFHLTIKFLGEVKEKQLPEIKEILEGLASFPRQQLLVKGIGVFPHYGYINAIWAGLECSSTLEKMKSQLEKEYAKLGFARDKYDFTPHFTLGRAKKVWAKEELVSTLKELKTTEFGVLDINKVKLKQSTLTPQGPIYETISEVELAEENRN